MANATELKNIVRLGTVMSVDKEKMTARVKFNDKGGIPSGPLQVLKRPVFVVSAMQDGNEGQTAETELEYDIGDITENVKHSHEVYIVPWLPSVNAMVLCIMIPDGDGDGFIVGEV